MTPEEMEMYYEKQYAKEYRKAVQRLQRELRDPKKVVEVAQKIARKRADRTLFERFGITYKQLCSKVIAEKLDLTLEELAV